MKLFGNHAKRDAVKAPKISKPQKTWFKMPRWAFICGLLAVLSVVITAIYLQQIRPPEIIPKQPQTEKATPPPANSEQPHDPDAVPTPTPEDVSKVPPGNWESIGRKESVYTDRKSVV